MAKTILAVDDSASIRQMVTFTLKSSGYEVVEAVDGATLVTIEGNAGDAVSRRVYPSWRERPDIAGFGRPASPDGQDSPVRGKRAS